MNAVTTNNIALPRLACDYLHSREVDPMRIAIVVFFLLLTSLGVADDWVPPENPDPQAIMAEAKADTTAGRYEDALAKQLWYHENAIQLQPSLTGVRLSFALMNWLELGEAYPPALEKMKQVRDETEKRIRDKNKVRIRFEDFHDFVALNETLREEQRTAELFHWIDKHDEEDAQRVFDVARPALIKQGDFELCGKYTDSENEMSHVDRNYTLGLKMAKDRFGEQHRKYVEKKFLNDVTTLAALLVKNGRISEATVVSARAKELAQNPELLEELTKQLEPAMVGTVPKPWP